MTERTRTLRGIVTYVALTVVFSSVFWALIIENHHIGAAGGTYVLALMWSPGLAALVTGRIYHRRRSEFGWGFGAWRYQLAGYALPIAYGLIAYSFIWIFGAGVFYDHHFVERVAKAFGWSRLAPSAVIVFYVLLRGTVGMAASCASALGEEIGWRGFLVPELSKVTSFTGVGLISGAIWAVWHYPEILFANYNGGTPAWFGLSCFTVMVVAMAFIQAWLRLKSRSLWPAVFLHASHNLFIQSIFNPLTLHTDTTKWFIDEFGAALPIACAVFALVFWTMRKKLPASSRSKDSS